MEYVKVTFPTRRLAYIDGEQNGYTNDVLRIDAGTHLFELGNLYNYEPDSQTVLVENTSVLTPLEVAFKRKDG